MCVCVGRGAGDSVGVESFMLDCDDPLNIRSIPSHTSNDHSIIHVNFALEIL